LIINQLAATPTSIKAGKSFCVTFRIDAVDALRPLLRLFHMAHCTIYLGNLSFNEIELKTPLRLNKTYTPLIYSAQAKVFYSTPSDGQKRQVSLPFELLFDPAVRPFSDDGQQLGSQMTTQARRVVRNPILRVVVVRNKLKSC
jgi:hypothetical protein